MTRVDVAALQGDLSWIMQRSWSIQRTGLEPLNLRITDFGMATNVPRGGRLAEYCPSPALVMVPDMYSRCAPDPYNELVDVYSPALSVLWSMGQLDHDVYDDLDLK